jgi:hypothetical protein
MSGSVEAFILFIGHCSTFREPCKKIDSDERSATIDLSINLI